MQFFLIILPQIPKEILAAIIIAGGGIVAAYVSKGRKKR